MSKIKKRQIFATLFGMIKKKETNLNQAYVVKRGNNNAKDW